MIIIIGIPTNWSIINISKHKPKNTKRISLPVHLKCLNLRAKRGSSDTSRKLKIIEIAHNSRGFKKNETL